MKHITFTSHLAGLTYCGEPRNEQDTYLHLGVWIDNEANRADLCPACWKLYEEADKADEVPT